MVSLPIPLRSLPAAALAALLTFLAGFAPPLPLEAQRPYAQVVTGQAETEEGLFHVHRVEGRLLFEIPDSILGRDMLLMSRYAETQMGLPLDGTQPGPEVVVRWEREGDRMRLGAISHEVGGDPDMPF